VALHKHFLREEYAGCISVNLVRKRFNRLSLNSSNHLHHLDDRGRFVSSFDELPLLKLLLIFLIKLGLNVSFLASRMCGPKEQLSLDTLTYNQIATLCRTMGHPSLS